MGKNERSGFESLKLRRHIFSFHISTLQYHRLGRHGLQEHARIRDGEPAGRRAEQEVGVADDGPPAGAVGAALRHEQGHGGHEAAAHGAGAARAPQDPDGEDGGAAGRPPALHLAEEQLARRRPLGQGRDHRLRGPLRQTRKLREDARTSPLRHREEPRGFVTWYRCLISKVSVLITLAKISENKCLPFYKKKKKKKKKS